MKRNPLIYFVSCCLGTILLYSCASYNYDSSRSDKSFTIKSNNQVDFVVTSIYDGKNLGTANSGSKYVSLEELKKKNLSFNLTHPNYEDIQVEIKRTPRPMALVKDVGLGIFTFGIPVVIDLFNSDFYMISKSNKEINVNFDYKQSFMIDEYQKIKTSADPLVFEKWISNYGKSTIVQDVIDHKDSLELSIALSKESEQAIDDYISSHQGSNYLKEAEQIKSEMILARELFEKTKIENSVSSYENFLAKYPKSIHNTEAHKRLIDAAEKVALASASSTKMASYINSYIIPNTRFLTKSELGTKTTTITKAIDSQLIKENIKSDPKKTYEYYSNLWKSYVNIKSTVNNEYIGHLEQTYGYQIKICNILFSKLKEANTQEKQTALVSKIKSDFPSLDINDSTLNPIIAILGNYNSGTGIIKLFGVNYLSYYFENLSESSPLKGLDVAIINGQEIQALSDVNQEDLSFVNGAIAGVNKCYNDSKATFSINIQNSMPKDVSYFIDGKLIRTIFFPNNYPSYYYEFSNGINLTLKASTENLNKLISIESSIRKKTNSGNYNEAISEFEAIIPFLESLVASAQNNPIPDGREKWLPKIEALEKLSKEAENKKEQSNYFTYKNKYITPSEIKYTILDNRKLCTCCSYSFAEYETRNAQNIQYQKVCQSINCNVERMVKYWGENGVAQNYRDADLKNYKNYLINTYKGLQYMALPIYVDSYLAMIPMIQNMELIADLTGQKNPKPLGSLNRNIDKYSVNGKYCSSRCANDYRCP
jgi:hypothetical protein